MCARPGRRPSDGLLPHRGGFEEGFPDSGASVEHGTAGAPAEDSRGVQAFARARGVSAAQVRLAWTLHRGAHVLAIPGTGDVDHLAQNVAAGSLHLSPDEVDELASLRPDEVEG
ncbi:aldo/keto reductase [Streptomyces hydrogenans]|uniref:aldo/keto reductase n=1 Tax=Streptomyces hydrogenans TaxID=1873719 RepID=UPI00380FCD5C